MTELMIVKLTASMLSMSHGDDNTVPTGRTDKGKLLVLQGMVVVAITLTAVKAVTGLCILATMVRANCGTQNPRHASLKLYPLPKKGQSRQTLTSRMGRQFSPEELM